MDVPKYKLWIALDMTDIEHAKGVVASTHDLVEGYKIHAIAERNMESSLHALKHVGIPPIRVWWDRKAHDTPDTVALIARCAVIDLGIGRLTVHAGGGIEMMMVARMHGPPEIVAITDLTSLSKAEIGVLSGMPADASVLQKAWLAKLAGLTHLVCSGEELALLNSRRQYSTTARCVLELHSMRFVVPGTRTITADMGSQKRSTTAMAALEAGADELVLGSEVWKSTNPRRAVCTIQERIQHHFEGTR